MGAFDDAIGSNGQQGSAYIFERDGSGMWNEAQKLTASDGAADDRFGVSVSIYAGRVIVGANLDDDLGSASGSAYIFERDGSGMWNEVQKLAASDGAANDQFGISASIYGDRAIVGAFGDDVGSNGNQGSAYIFERDGIGTWNEVDKLTASDGAFNDQFGISASIYGDRAIVGANFDNGNRGSAYIFERDGSGTWNEARKLTASDGAAGHLFGISVSIYGGRVIVGSVNGDAGKGSAYVFELEAADSDGDGVFDNEDNCPDDPNSGQEDGDSDGLGDVCDACPNDAQNDSDDDGACDNVDECPVDPNKTLAGECGCGIADTDGDGDGTADCLDLCPVDPNKVAPGVCGCGVADTDSDGDGIADCNDSCPNDPQNDVDGDGVCGNVDNCPTVPNPGQTDSDSDGTGDACEEETYHFSGFFQPVDNPPTFNVTKGGGAVPVKFSLGGDQGLDIFATGFPRSLRIDCETAAPQDAIEQTVTAGSSSLSYDASTDQYTYVWKTDKSWAGTCRGLELKLNGGTDLHIANFKFR